ISLLAWTVAILAALLSIERQNRVLGALLLASAALGAAAMNSGSTYVDAVVPGWELTAHILLSMAAAALLFAAALTALLLIFLDHRLRAHRISGLPSILPPLDALERAMFRLIGIGFSLLTLALFTGFVFVTNLFTQHLIHKTVLSLVAWTIFGALLVGRMRFGWRGRSAVGWTLSGFGFLALAYFGSKFVLEDVFGRHWG
ncbi:MAG TPA: cytochrome c biogenesis protein CcsA, partial [Steroidobacteraceae bacterium]|nr:cytochrome c biogenesis protein CcsA [Steroidobacteraceae bacterium]